MLDPKPEGKAPLVGCRFEDPKHPGSGFEVVGLSVTIGTDTSDAKFAFDTGKRNSGGAPAVSGLGDDAYWADALSTLEVLKGKYDISIAVAPDIKDAQSVAKGLAAKVVSRLP